jgi:hypothetical protein
MGNAGVEKWMRGIALVYHTGVGGREVFFVLEIC